MLKAPYKGRKKETSCLHLSKKKPKPPNLYVLYTEQRRDSRAEKKIVFIRLLLNY